MQDEYVIYGGSISLFTRKLEAAMRFYGAPHRIEPKTEEAGTRSQSRQVPVLQTPENWMIADTTPLIGLLDARFPRRRLCPPGALGVLVHVVEEVLDEWFARTMVHFRWHYEENTRFVVGEILGRKVSAAEAAEFPLAKWGPRACRATGTESEHQQREVEREYFAMLDVLETQLASTAYALGGRPTAVDAILLGGLRGHTNNDPVPNLAAYPRVVAWDEKEADRWDGGGELASFPESTPFVDHVLDVGRDCYADFVLGNAKALEAGEKAFVVETYGEEVSYLTRPYPEESRRMVSARIRDHLDGAERAEVGRWLEARGLAACFMPG
jgi:glutathione S-transferase